MKKIKRILLIYLMVGCACVAGIGTRRATVAFKSPGPRERLKRRPSPCHYDAGGSESLTVACSTVSLLYSHKYKFICQKNVYR